MTPGKLGELAGLLPALLDPLGHVGVGVSVLVDRGTGFERWYANGPAAAMLGYTVDELMTVPAIETIAPAQRPLVAQMSASFRAGQTVPAAVQITTVCKDGSLLPVEVALGYVRLPDGVAYVMVFGDASAQPQAQLSLLEADRVGLVGALAAGFAHEINNPLTSVLLNLRSLRKLTQALPAAAQAQAMRSLDAIVIGAERIASNVKALQTLATRSPTVAIDLAAVVSAALRIAAPTLEPRAHVVRQIYPVARVVGEESRVGQAVLAMLLFSSAGFDPERPSTANQIVVSVEPRGDDVVLEVSDNGRELTPEETQHAFDPFYRSSVRGNGVGVGLGVARLVAA
ncbi:MAG: PAS domain-containing sensor histidine kinase, partial [Myxococcales bacterium]|nr:PAS domain-containing sensor histidine kinase [Myxococcales bacterium]